MDFVKGLGDTSHLQDVLVDDIGRAEVWGGRVRITLCRVIEDADGGHYYGAVIPLIWTLDAWRASRPKHAMMRALIEGNGVPIAPPAGSPLHH